MTSLLSLPNELSWTIASTLDIEDVINLSKASRRLYQYVYSDEVSKAVAQVSEIILKSAINYFCSICCLPSTRPEFL
jgi:hypothetical protein